MSRIFLTKVWGFNPESYPALGFNREGGRDKFLGESSPGDWVVLAGTKGSPTKPEYQGRLLGKVRLGKDQIDVEEVLRSIGTEIPSDHYLEDGRYKWPFGLPMIEAYRFPDLPDLADLFGDYLTGFQWASYALNLADKLGPEAQARVEGLRTVPARIVEAEAITRQRAKQGALVLNQTKTGPGPSDTRRGSNRDPGPASAYLFELISRTKAVFQGSLNGTFKVGYSGDVDDRLESLNKGLVSSVTGYSWKVVTTQEFPTAEQAYAFEQALHARLRHMRVAGEQEVYSITRKALETEWSDVFARGDWVGTGEKV